MQKILIVEDGCSFQDMYERDLEGYHLLQAYTLQQGRDLFRASADEIEIVILDGSLGNNEFGDVLAKEIREAGYTGPMIATSSSSALNNQLFQSGCNYAARKEDVCSYIKTQFFVEK